MGVKNKNKKKPTKQTQENLWKRYRERGFLLRSICGWITLCDDGKTATTTSSSHIFGFYLFYIIYLIHIRLLEYRRADWWVKWICGKFKRAKEFQYSSLRLRALRCYIQIDLKVCFSYRYFIIIIIIVMNHLRTAFRVCYQAVLKVSHLCI